MKLRHRWLGLVLAFAIAGSAAAVTGTQRAQPPVAPYVEVSDGPSAALLRRLPAAHLKHAELAFVVAQRKRCVAAWDGAGAVTQRPFARAIAALVRAGARPTLAFGGQSGRELALTCRTPQALAAAYESALTAYGLSRADFDLEQSGLSPRVAQRRAAALKLLEQAQPGLQLSLTLPVSTGGMPPEAVTMLRAALTHGVRIDGVNVMAMDFGNSDAPHPKKLMARYIEQSALAAHRQLMRLGSGLGAWSRFILTVMIGHNDVRGEVVTLRDARTIAGFARGHHLEAVRYWSFNRDQSAAAYAAALAGRS